MSIPTIDRRHRQNAFQLDALRLLSCLAACCISLSCFQFASAQLSNIANSQTDPSGKSSIFVGFVLNGNTNQPVARALVQVGPNAVLTEHDGRFEFTASAGTSETVRVSKPGYFDGLDQNFAVERFTFGTNADPVKVYLFPEGLITGTLTAPNGDPVPNIYVQALRKTGDESGPSWTLAGQLTTNFDGQFRIPLGAGDYVIETHSIADPFFRQQVFMPSMAPDPANGGESAAQPTIHLESGSEEHLDLRPQLRPLHDVRIRIEGTEYRGVPRVEAQLSNGLSFFPTLRQADTPNDFILTMPTGSYLLTISTSGEGGSYAQAAVTVGESETASVVMRLASPLSIPVEVVVDSSSSATSDNNSPAVQQLALHFVRTSETAPQVNNQNVYLHSSRGEPSTFSLVPGTYRFLALPQSNWFIASATIANTDLLAHDLDVEAGETSAPLRIVVSNHTAGIKGTVKIAGSTASNCWVYLIAATPGIVPVISITTAADGSFTRPAVPPGNYRAVALETRRAEDFSDAATLERLAPYMKSFTVAPGEAASLALDAVPTAEIHP